MTREEKIKRIEELEHEIFCINIGADYLSHEDRLKRDACYAEIDKLEAELKAEENGN